MPISRMRVVLFALLAFTPNVLPLVVGTELMGYMIVTVLYLLLIPLAMAQPWKWPLLLMSSATNVINGEGPVPLCVGLALIYAALHFGSIKSALAQATPLSIFLGLSALAFLGSIPFAIMRGANPLGIPLWYAVYFVAPIVLVLMGMTLRVPRNRVGLWIIILIFYAAGTWLAFYFLGQPEAFVPDALNPRLNAIYYELGKASLTFTRTQISIAMAAAAAACLAIMLVGRYLYLAIPFFCLIILVMLRLGSVGSMAALAASALVTISLWLLGEVKRKFRNRKRIFAFCTIAVLAVILIQTTFKEEARYFQARLESKYDEFRRYGLTGIDRYPYWMNAVQQIKENPFGEGWSLAAKDENWVNAHNDYLVYGMSYGILGGATYLFLIIWVLVSGLRKVWRSFAQDWEIANGLVLLGAGSVMFLNSFIDHLVPNRMNFFIVWALIAMAFTAETSPPDSVLPNRPCQP